MVYDVLVLGAGSAGYTAAIYASRYKMSVAVIGTEPGGLINEAHLVENYPGFVSISGRELTSRFKENIDHLKIPLFQEDIVYLGKSGDLFKVKTDKNEYLAKTIVLGLGTKRRRLNVEGEEKFAGRGVSYCFTCDAPFYKNKDAVGVVGGNDSAAMASLLLADYAKKVYIIYRKAKLRAQPVYFDKIKEKGNIEYVYNSNVVEVFGDQFVEGVKLDTGKELKVNGLFIEIGQTPSVDLVKELGVELDDKDYIKVDSNCETSIPGVYAAGDITNTPLRQVIVAAGQGAIAALSAYKYINQVKK